MEASEIDKLEIRRYAANVCLWVKISSERHETWYTIKCDGGESHFYIKSFSIRSKNKNAFTHCHGTKDLHEVVALLVFTFVYLVIPIKLSISFCIQYYMHIVF